MSNSTGLTSISGGDPELLANPSLCTLSTCDMTLAILDYIPSLGGNAVFAGVFGLCILVQLFFGIRYKTWGYMIVLCCGLAGEVVGYIGRIMIFNNPFDDNAFLIYLVPLTISPALISAGIYLCLARIIVIYGENLSRFKPRTYTIVFCTCDFVSLLVQSVGGAIASIYNDHNTIQLGVNIMIAGVSLQVAFLAAFAIAAGEFAFRAYKAPQSWTMSHAALYESKLFKSCLVGLAVATVAIFARSIYRCAELSGGFGGPLANDQVSFMILEAAMMTIAVLCLTILHPGLCFQGKWVDANFKFRSAKNKGLEGSIDVEMEGQTFIAAKTRTIGRAS